MKKRSSIMLVFFFYALLSFGQEAINAPKDSINLFVQENKGEIFFNKKRIPRRVKKYIEKITGRKLRLIHECEEKKLVKRNRDVLLLIAKYENEWIVGYQNVEGFGTYSEFVFLREDKKVKKISSYYIIQTARKIKSWFDLRNLVLNETYQLESWHGEENGLDDL